MQPEEYQTKFYHLREPGCALPSQLPPPPYRRLRGYAFDPSLSLRLETALINETVFQVPWEPGLEPGPAGEYLEVLDCDPASECWYEPVDLNNVELLAQDGLAPSEGNPQFHQQMVYAVAMNTIRHFEHALGRPIFWAPKEDPSAPTGRREVFVRALRLYPHALRAANAYYSPQRKALLFGYFPGPTGMVFTCLSHDIIAHEITHAILDGMHRRYVEDNHEDTLAFHEAFADLIALLQHFTFQDVLRHQIARTRGDLTSPSLLGELAQQFGEATGRIGALRSALGARDASGHWKAHTPDPAKLEQAREPHARGSVLVAAVFGAFVSLYRSKVADLIRIATSGTGVLQPGAIHPDLVERLATIAAKTAQHFLTMCIRALDYCPPVDITFGDYLRALVTADFDMVPNDRHGYRTAVIESFRQWGIVPDDVRTHSEEHLRWTFARLRGVGDWNPFREAAAKLRAFAGTSLYVKDREVAFNKSREIQGWMHNFFHSALTDSRHEELRHRFEEMTGLVLSPNGELEGLLDDRTGVPFFEVHAVRPALRVSPDGRILKQVIITLAQRRHVSVDPEDPESPKFTFRGGSTLILDLDTLNVRYAITKSIGSQRRLARSRKYRQEKSQQDLSLRATYFGERAAEKESGPAVMPVEPFRLLHDAE